jgi:hypothetical protein
MEFARNLRNSLRCTTTPDKAASNGFLDRMTDGLQRFRKPILILLSGNDLTAAEFDALAKSAWRLLLQRKGISWYRLAAANHTFGTETWRDQVGDETKRWLAALTDSGVTIDQSVQKGAD